MADTKIVKQANPAAIDAHPVSYIPLAGGAISGGVKPHPSYGTLRNVLGEGGAGFLGGMKGGLIGGGATLAGNLLTRGKLGLKSNLLGALAGSSIGTHVGSQWHREGIPLNARSLAAMSPATATAALTQKASSALVFGVACGSIIKQAGLLDEVARRVGHGAKAVFTGHGGDVLEAMTPKAQGFQRYLELLRFQRANAMYDNAKKIILHRPTRNLAENWFETAVPQMDAAIRTEALKSMGTAGATGAAGIGGLAYGANKLMGEKKSSIAGVANKLAPLSGAAIGGALGAASGPEGHVLQNAGRGAVRGFGTQLGVGIGGIGGGVAGGAAGALSGAALGGLLSLALRRRVDPKNLMWGMSMAGGQLGALGGLGAGMYHGGRAGYDAAGKLMGPASYAKQSSTGGEKQAIMVGGTVGALGGLATSKKNKRGLGAGRGALIGAGTELGVYPGAAIGGLSGLALARVISSLANRPHNAAIGDMATGGALGAGLGAVGGGYLGNIASRALLDDSSHSKRDEKKKKKDEETKEAFMGAAGFGALLGQLAAQKAANVDMTTLGAHGSAGPRLANSGQAPGSASARMMGQPGNGLITNVPAPGTNNNGLLGPGGSNFPKHFNSQTHSIGPAGRPAMTPETAQMFAKMRDGVKNIPQQILAKRV